MTQDISESVDFAPTTEEAPSSNGGKSTGARSKAGRSSTASFDARIERRRRRWPWLAAGVALGAGATWAILAAGGDETTSVAPSSETVQLSTVVVETRDLIEEVDYSGTLAAGLSVIVNASDSGVITAAAATGESIERGDVIAVIGVEPVVALYGDVPMWRDLADGDTGADVRQLEANLVQLGFDPDGTVTVDESYTSDTATMVESWEESLGLDTTGRVRRARVAVLAGPSVVVDPAVVGASARSDAQLAVLATTERTSDVVGWQDDATDESPGAIMSIAAIGTPVEQGTVLYSVDDSSVVAVVTSSPVTDAVLKAFGTDDVEQVEGVLAYLGFDPDGAMTIDDELDDATLAAVERWQTSIGLPASGSVDRRDYAVLSADAGERLAIDAHYATPGDLLGEGRIVLGVGTPMLSVSADVAVSEIDQFNVGDVVQIVQLDDTEFTATVSTIASVSSGTTAGQNAEPTVAVTFEVTDAPDRYVSGSVTITVVSSRVDAAVVVPTRALVTLREGGFAVEVSDADGSTHLVGVELGVFDDGSVQITNGSVQAGELVVVPS